MLILLPMAGSIGFLHTVLGPDHYVPFVVMSRARGWSAVKTALITFLCGLGHVASSVVLGAIGIAAGIALTKLEGIESARGEIAAWLLIGFGAVYFAWGLRRAMRGKSHTHAHLHRDGALHEHEHDHESAHLHVHADEGKPSLTPWILFTVFLFGPCEPLIPLLMFPAAAESASGVFLVASVFGAVTIGTMLAAVLALSFGLRLVSMKPLERYSHALAGATICLCGLAIRFLGL